MLEHFFENFELVNFLSKPVFVLDDFFGCEQIFIKEQGLDVWMSLSFEAVSLRKS
jgi:hypothetical protein